MKSYVEDFNVFLSSRKTSLCRQRDISKDSSQIVECLQNKSWCHGPICTCKSGERVTADPRNKISEGFISESSSKFGSCPSEVIGALSAPSWLNQKARESWPCSTCVHSALSPSSSALSHFCFQALSCSTDGMGKLKSLLGILRINLSRRALLYETVCWAPVSYTGCLVSD